MGCSGSKKLAPLQPSHTDSEIDVAFRKADGDGNGAIDVHELAGAMASLGIPPRSFELALETMRRYDRDGDGSLQLDEFRVLAQEVRRHVQDAEASFAAHDTDRNGRIDVRELFSALSAMGLAETMEHAEGVMAKFSVEQSRHGTLSLDEYRKVVERCRTFQKHKSTFRRFDTDGNGSIDRRELFDALSALGLLTSQADAERVFAKFDADGSGSLQLPEFVKLADSIGQFKLEEHMERMMHK